MRKAVYLSEAIRAVIVIVAALFIISVYPLRLWHRTITETAGGVRMETSGQIDDGHDLIQDFIMQYDDLESIDFYVEEELSGRTVALTVYDDRMIQIFHKYIDLDEYEIPGYVHIPIGIQQEVGKSVRLFFMSAFGAYTMGLQNIPEDASPYFTTLYINDTTIDGWRLDVKLNYRQPLDKKTSLLIILAIALTALVLERLTAFIAKKLGPDKDPIVTVGGTLRMTTFPVLTVLWIALLILIYPLKRFDDRTSDVIFYFIGVVIAGILIWLCFYAERWKTKLSPEVLELASPSNRWSFTITTVIEAAQVAALALAVQATCDYMNGLVDSDHMIAARKEVIWLSVFLILFLFGRSGKEEEEGRKWRPNPFAFVVVAFFVLAVLFRGERMWGLVLALTFAGGLVCFYFSRRKDRWLPVLTAGLLTHFLVSVGYCLLKRYFVAFVSPRFPFTFHTVTVTAEYLTVMMAASFALLFAAICRLPAKTPVWQIFMVTRREAVLFGITSSYMLFTVSRTGIVAAAGCIFVLLIAIAGKGHRIRDMLMGVLVSVTAVVVTFPAVFTLQRVIPPMVGRPDYFAIEDAVADLKGATNWDSRYFINTVRFSDIFFEKILGFEPVSFDFPEDDWNYYPNMHWKYKPVGTFYWIPEDWEKDLIMPEDKDREAEIMADMEMVLQDNVYDTYRHTGAPMVFKVNKDKNTGEGGDLIDEESFTDRASNGRLTIWRNYLPNLNLDGHKEMGVLMPNGEVAVHAHDVYLQVMYDHGIIAGVVFLAMMLLAFITSVVYAGLHRKDGQAWVACVPLALTVGFGVAGIAEWNFHLGNMMTLAMLFSWVPLCFKSKGK